MNEKVLKWLIYVAGGVCLYAFISIRSLPFMNAVLSEKMIPEHWDFVKYGELYYFNYISHFKVLLPKAQQKYRFSDKHPDVNQADILMFGDSFLDISRQTTLPERLNDSIGKRVFFHRFLNPHGSNPLCYLDQNGYSNERPKYLIYESVERNIPIKFDTAYSAAGCRAGEPGVMELALNQSMDLTFPENAEEMYKQLLKRSVLTTRLFELSATLKFDLLGYISSQTPVYKLGAEPWLFYFPQVSERPGSFYYEYTDEQINTYCNNIASLRAKLKEEYDLEMIFLPVPSKYSIYHKVVNNDPYNNFLPQLYEGLSRRDVPYIDLLSDFQSNDQVLYYGTDTHWNKLGVDIALEKLVEKLKTIDGEHDITLANN
jgi:hypothetical protein